jgi:hypothetical protein
MLWCKGKNKLDDMLEHPKALSSILKKITSKKQNKKKKILD